MAVCPRGAGGRAALRRARGASGIMVPCGSTPAEAEEAAAAIQYPPEGERGVAILTRASGFGVHFDEYFE